MTTEDHWATVAQLSDLAEGEVLGVELGDKQIALYNVGGTIHATDNICTHAFARLSDGYLEGFEIRCPLHGGGFDVRTGEATAAPCFTPIAVYECRVDGDEVMVRIEDEATPASAATAAAARLKD